MMKMRKYIYLLLIAAATGSITKATAQHKAYEMMVNGVKVIVQPSGNDIVEIQTVIKGGVQNYPATKMGIEAMAFAALTECGTLKHDKNSFKNQLPAFSYKPQASTLCSRLKSLQLFLLLPDTIARSEQACS